MANPKTLINVAALLGPLVIVFVVLGFATDHWTDTDVDETKLNSVMRSLANSNQELARVFHSRNKGIIRECYPKDNAKFLDYAQNVVNGDCFYIDFDNPEGMDISSDYSMRMHLMRSVLATYVLGLVGVILTFILGIILCCAKNSHMAHLCAVCSCLGGMFVLSSIVLFHAQEYVEANKHGDAGEIVFHENWSQDLLVATDTTLGYSYALAWLGLILAIVDGIIYIMAARALRLRETGDDASSDASLPSDRHKVMKKSQRPPMDADFVYDNYGMKYAASVQPTPMFFEGHPGFMQTMPGYPPSLTYGQTAYKMGSSHNSREA